MAADKLLGLLEHKWLLLGRMTTPVTVQTGCSNKTTTMLKELKRLGHGIHCDILVRFGEYDYCLTNKINNSDRAMTDQLIGRRLAIATSGETIAR